LVFHSISFLLCEDAFIFLFCLSSIFVYFLTSSCRTRRF
jgi:hypothetical protein